MARLRVQRDACYDKYRYLWEGPEGITFNQFSDDVKRGMAVEMSAAPASWPVEVRALCCVMTLGCHVLTCC